MKYYIAPLDEDMQEEVSSPYVYGGTAYEFCVEYGSNPGCTDELVIKDTVGREVPITIEAITSLVAVLTDIKQTSNALENLTALEANVLNPKLTVA